MYIIAIVLRNFKDQSSIEAHSCRSTWSGTAVLHLREYRRTTVGEGSQIVLEPTDEYVKVMVSYTAVIRTVELHVDGRLMQGDASALSKGGWSLKMEDAEKFERLLSSGA